MVISSEARPWTRLSVWIAMAALFIQFLPLVQALFAYSTGDWLLGLWVLWALVILLERPADLFDAIRLRRGELLIYAVWFTLIFGYALFGSSAGHLDATMGRWSRLAYSLAQITACYLIAITYAQEPGQKALRWLSATVVAGFGLNALISLPALVSDELMVRALVNSYQSQTQGLEEMTLSLYTLGGLGLYAAEALLVPFGLAFAMQAKGWNQVIWWLLLLSMGLNVLLSSLLIPLMMMLLSVGVLLGVGMVRRGFSTKARLMLLLAIIMFGLVGLQFSQAQAARYTVNRVYAMLDPTYTEKVQGNTLEKRQQLYGRSINMFLQYPVTGAGVEPLSLIQYSSGIGGHSGILDALAMYGLLFGLYFWFLWVKFGHVRRHSRQNPTDWTLLARMITFAGYLFTILLDPVLFNSTTSGVFFFLVVGSTLPLNTVLFSASGLKLGLSEGGG